MSFPKQRTKRKTELVVIIISDDDIGQIILAKIDRRIIVLMGIFRLSNANQRALICIGHDGVESEGVLS